MCLQHGDTDRSGRYNKADSDDDAGSDYQVIDQGRRRESAFGQGEIGERHCWTRRMRQLFGERQSWCCNRKEEKDSRSETESGRREPLLDESSSVGANVQEGGRTDRQHFHFDISHFAINHSYCKNQVRTHSNSFEKHSSACVTKTYAHGGL